MSKTLYIEEEERSQAGAPVELKLFEEIISRAVLDARAVPIELTERKEQEKLLNKLGKDKFDEALARADKVAADKYSSRHKKSKKLVTSVGRTEETIAARDAIDFLMTPERSDVFLHIVEVDPEMFRENMFNINKLEAASENERKARRIFRANVEFYKREKACGRRV